VLAAGTDGTDGPTDAAGGLVDGDSCRLAAAEGVPAEEALENNDSHRFLKACGGLIVTGPTQSNVNDLFVVVRT
jgi:glycerate-2-kinase